MIINNAFMNSLSPAELEFVKSYVLSLVKDTVTSETSNSDNLVHTVSSCPYCHSARFIKWGFNNHRQRYQCSACGRFFSPTTNTMFSHSSINYETWSSFIECELMEMTLADEANLIHKSKTTCFHMRHKLYQAVGRVQDQILTGNIEIDSTYTKINLKGTKPRNMPRRSKKRGKHKQRPKDDKDGWPAKHKVCIATAMDQNDVILFRIIGLGVENLDKYRTLKNRFKPGSTLICDNNAALHNFAKEAYLKTDSLIRTLEGVLFTTPTGSSLAEINELHSEFKELNRKKHGISTRHLQGYLDWFVFRKSLRYSVESSRRKSEAYLDAMTGKVCLTNRSIYKKAMPISLWDAYGDWHYGIFENFTN